jgi:EmrB/QacA subfamily drug resistance transporter
VQVGLPSIRADLGGSVTAMQWVLDGYLLVLTSLLVFAGSTADRLGRRPVFVAGLLLFGTSSALCGLAPSVEWLVAARVLQGVGGAMLNPVALAIIVGVHPDPARRARAIGWWSAVSGLGIAAGPPLGGLVTELLGWRWIFWVNVPVAVLAVGLTLRLVPDSRAAVRRRLDPVGQLLLTAAVAAVVVALIESPLALLVLVPAVAGLVAYELRHPSPVLDPALFRSPALTAAVGAAVAGFAAFSGCLFALSFLLQEVQGRSPSAVGLLVLPLGLAALVTAPLAGRLVARGWVRATLAAAGLVLTTSLVVLLLAVGRDDALGVASGAALFGVGFGLLNPPVTATAVSGLPPERAAVAGAVASTARQLGQCVGVALTGALVVHGEGGRVAFATLAALALVVTGLALATRPARPGAAPRAPRP